MRVLIIGGTGNISTPIAEALVARGDEVLLFNRGAKSISGARAIVGDRKDHRAFEAAFRDAGRFDCVVDMICYTEEDALSAIAAFTGRTNHFIFCSTVDTYEKPARRYPVREGDARGAIPAFEYAHSKVLCELAFEAARDSAGFPLTILRPAATYNDDWTPIGLVGSGLNVLKRIAEGKAIIVPGDGTSLWVSSHRDDVARAFVAAIDSKATIGKDYNIAGDEALTWVSYYEIAAGAMGAPKPEFLRVPSDLLAELSPAAASWCAYNFRYSNIFDCSAAKRDLGYRYTVTWAEGCRRMFERNASRVEVAPFEDEYERVAQVWIEARAAALGKKGEHGDP